MAAYIASLVTLLVLWSKSDRIPQSASTGMRMRIATYNLRYDSQPDRITVPQSLDALPDPLERPRFLNKTGEQPWSTRRIKVAQQLLNEEPILIGWLIHSVK